MCEVKPEKGAEKMKVYCQFEADGKGSLTFFCGQRGADGHFLYRFRYPTSYPLA